MKNKHNKSLIINDVSKLEDYGFIKKGNNYYFYTGNQNKFGDIYTIRIAKRTNAKKTYQFYCSSHASTTLEVICKLYKDGIISFQDYCAIDEMIERKKQKIAQLQKEIEALENEKED